LDAHARYDAAPMVDTTTQRERWRVLVIDDEPAIGRLLKNLLAKHEVEVVSSGESALERLREGGDYDVIICDLTMPGISGIDVHAWISTERPGLEQRMVFITGGAFTETSAAFLDTVPNSRLDKPFTLAALEAAMNAAAARGESEREREGEGQGSR
jgi:CheY-like chemotaxis protein